MVAEHSGSGIRPEIKPRASLRQRADAGLRAATPVGFAFLSTLVLSAPLGLPGQSELLFSVLFGTVFFWSAQRPRQMPPWAVFALGLFAEMVTFGAPGSILFMLLVVHGIAHLGRHSLTAASFLTTWAILSVLATISGVVQWTMASVEAFHLLGPAPSLFQTTLTIGIYPILSAVFAWANRTVANPERA
ncbi:hypothetical protein Tasa_017_061 [Tanticharoenia sakaeratensis NBRC 103193]|jgi:rod shape-determining protein MreD|uniref:Rod shape-determining protein MreD n=2 Tax=Tanticharoenia TaxID=444052 RepID=A0A0D6MLI7_9PROT|nr:hypothetical protein Tasa_017_061 [Tanticharoenia sakaeratensis NBRC 103193]GBQ19368.1 rod shape-determining protein MreD [Tanticharoenia sakaeratensis NBRC 103193]